MPRDYPYESIPDEKFDSDNSDLVYLNGGEAPSTKYYKKFGLALFVTVASILAAVVSLGFINVRANVKSPNLREMRDFGQIYGQQTRGAFKLGSAAFGYNGTLPDKYTCKLGDDTGVSPPLNWSHVPQNAEDFMIVMWKTSGYSWGVYNISTTLDHLDEAESVNGIAAGTVEFDTTDKHVSKFMYDEPCSKGPGLKSYVFYIFAFSTRVKPVMDLLGLGVRDVNPIIIANAMVDDILDVAALPVNFDLYN